LVDAGQRMSSRTRHSAAVLVTVTALAIGLACKPQSGPASVEVYPSPSAHRDADASVAAAPSAALSPAGVDLAGEWVSAFRRQDVAGLTTHTAYPFEFRDMGTAGRIGSGQARRSISSAREMTEMLAPLFADEVLERTIGAERDGRIEERADIPYWAEPWRADAPPGLRPLQAYFSANDAAFSFVFFADQAGVRALWKNGFDASLETALATQWVDALRRKDVDTLQRLTRFPFELRDSGVEAHCGSRRAANSTQLPTTVDCLLSDPIFGQALSRIRSGVEAGRTQDYEPGVFRGWRRPEHADLWPATLLIGNGAGNEYDICFLVAKNGVRAFWKRGSFISRD
jgi:hypothetical protein